MMDEDIFVIGTFFFTVIVLALGIPIVRSWVRQRERTPLLPPPDPVLHDRLQRIEHAVEAMAVEVERISEGQRFVTRLLAEREAPRAALPPERHEAP
jgi:hypothetical protein